MCNKTDCIYPSCGCDPIYMPDTGCHAYETEDDIKQSLKLLEKQQIIS